MARVDDFENAFKLARAELVEADPQELAQAAGAAHDPEKQEISFQFIGADVVVRLPEYRAFFATDGSQPPPQEQALIARYLNQADGAGLLNQDITYREVTGGEFYYAAFVKRAELPLISVFGRQAARLSPAALELGGQEVPGLGDAAVRVHALPRIPITFIIHEGDDEFEPAATILFDRSINHYLTAEDVAVLASLTVYRLMRAAR